MNTESDDAPPVTLERPAPHVALIRLNRPAAHNAINAAMAAAIEAHVATVEADPQLRVGIVAAAGPTFCAGADLKEVAAGRAQLLARPETGFAGFGYARQTKPWIAAVQGAAFGGGFEIALACDMVVAGEAARFGLPEVCRGLIAGAGGVYRVARALPRALALELVTTGAPIGARRAYEAGLVNAVVPTEAVVDEALRLAGLISANSPLSVRESLAVTRAAVDGDEAALRQRQDAAIARVLAGPDMIEGATAFVEKRAPQWRS